MDIGLGVVVGVLAVAVLVLQASSTNINNLIINRSNDLFYRFNNF
jgi:hypothetical protein